VAGSGEFQAFGNKNYRFCRDCKEPKGDLAGVVNALTNFPVGTPATFFGNNTPAQIRYFKGRHLSPVSNPNCSTFVFFIEPERDPFVRPSSRTPVYCGGR
jgi:hypothetical protein